MEQCHVGACMPADNASSLNDSSALDLVAALQELSSHPYVSQWKPDKSVYKLLYIFCLPQLDKLLNKIKLLSSTIEKSSLENISIRCVDQGEVAQLAALLLFAWDSLVVSDADQGIEYSPIAKHMKLVLLYNRSHDFDASSEKQILSALRIFQVLHSVRNIILSYREDELAMDVPEYDVVFDIAYAIWKKSRDDCKLIPEVDIYSDDIPCLRPQLSPKRKVVLKASLQSKMSSSSSSISDSLASDLDGKHSADDDCSSKMLDDDDDVDDMDCEDESTISMEGDSSELDDDHYDEFIYFKDASTKSIELNEDHLHDMDLEWALRDSIDNDDSDAFVKSINMSKDMKFEEDLRSSIAELVVTEDTVKCFEAILDHKTDVFLTVGDIVPADAPGDWTLLHQAAKWSATKIIAVLLKRGADANTKVTCSDLKSGLALPLDVTLSRLRCRCRVFWTVVHSAVGLIATLSDHAASNNLEAVRLLALKTDEIQQRFVEYLEDGKIVEVCALLMVAHKQLLSSSDHTGFTSIEDWCDSLKRKYFGESRSLDKGVLPQPQLIDTRERRETLFLMKIFCNVGDELAAYVQLKRRFELIPQEIALEIVAILEDAGLSVPHKDVYTCSSYRKRGNEFGRYLMRHDESDLLIRASSEICHAQC